MLRTAALIFALYLGGATASAQEAAVAPTPAAPADYVPRAAPTPDEISRARTRADAILAKGQASTEFVNITYGAFPAIRHKHSGLICVFRVDSEFSEVEDLGRNGAACTEQEQGVLTRIWLSRSPSVLSVQEIFKMMADVPKRHVHPDTQPYSGRIVTMEASELPQSFSAYVTYSDKNGRLTGAKGNPVVSRSSLARFRGWDIKMIASTANKDDQSGVYLGTVSGLAWLAALKSLATKPQ